MKGLKLVIKFGGNGLKKLKSQTFSDMKLPEKSEKKENDPTILQRDPGDFLRPSKPPNQAFGLVRSFE